jgi:8-oxo-dGTP pyrophosphatase MutT (NUDIX family)
MHEYKCEKGCCSIFAKTYEGRQNLKPKRRYYKKAGVFIFDPELDRVLLVQSRGQLWGPPKGTLEIGETVLHCAVREVKEETGIDVLPTNFSRATKIKNRATYFYLERAMCPVSIQEDVEDNDVNGITWIKLNCLKQCIKDGYIVLNQHCRMVFVRFMDRTFPKSDFIKVVSKRRRRKKRTS